MNVNFFIAKRIFSSGKESQKLSNRIVRLALIGIALGLVVMILSVAIVTGFKNGVTEKVVGFGSHLQIINYDSNQSYETEPLDKEQDFLEDLNSLEGINHVQKFATKPGIIKTDDEVQVIVLKGISTDFDWSFFEGNKLKGERINFNDSVKSNEIWLSAQTASLLKLDIGDKVLMYFIGNKQLPRNRVFTLAGIFQSGLQELDNTFALVDIRHIQRLNGWSEDQISGFEVAVENIDLLDDYEMEVRDMVINHMAEGDPLVRVVNIKREYPQIFDWLNLLDMNVWVILVLMLVVAGFNMVSGLLIIMLERVQMIGILKSIGSPDWSIRKVFLYFSGMLIGRALLWGNLIGISICLIQKYFGILKLDPTSYYLKFVPINLSFSNLLLLNLGTIAFTMLMLIVPSYFISKISPEKTIRFN